MMNGSILMTIDNSYARIQMARWPQYGYLKRPRNAESGTTVLHVDMVGVYPGRFPHWRLFVRETIYRRS